MNTQEHDEQLELHDDELDDELDDVELHDDELDDELVELDDDELVELDDVELHDELDEELDEDEELDDTPDAKDTVGTIVAIAPLNLALIAIASAIS